MEPVMLKTREVFLPLMVRLFAPVPSMVRSLVIFSSPDVRAIFFGACGLPKTLLSKTIVSDPGVLLA